MKGAGQTFNFTMWLVIGLVVLAGVVYLPTFVGRAVGGELGNTISNESAAKFSSQEINICKFNCEWPLSKCTIVPCKKLNNCKTAADEERTCAKYFGALETASGSSGGGGGSGGGAITVSDTVSFEGAFLPGGKVNIILPDSLKSEYSPDKFDSHTFDVIISGNDGICYQCVPSAPKGSPLEFTIFSIFNLAGEEIESPKCVTNIDSPLPQRCVFSLPPDAGSLEVSPISITLPYGRDSNNIETLIKDKTQYTIKLLHIEKVEGDINRDVIRGEKSFSWSCPTPTATPYAAGNDVEFTFSPAWVNRDKYNDSATTIEVGVRKGLSGTPCFDSGTGTWVATCEMPSQKPDATHKSNWFKMPYTASGKTVGISYPVYAKDIKIGGADNPMCRSGPDITYTCPASACYEDSGRFYVLSTFNPSGAYISTNPACKYDAKSTECPYGCRESGGGEPAECALPKPDIVAVFMHMTPNSAKYPGIASSAYDFDTVTGTYKPVKDFIITQDNHLSGKKWARIIIKNSALPGYKGYDPVIKSKDITINAWLDGVSRDVMPVAHRFQTFSTLVTPPKYVWDSTASVGPDTELKPGEYFEYDVDLVDTVFGESFGLHSGSVSETPLVAVESSTRASTYSYTMYQDWCTTCSRDALLNKEDCDLCGGRCAWSITTGFEASCKKA